jgi:uncharacterized membrane protein YfcA
MILENKIETIKVTNTATDKPAKSFEFTWLNWWILIPVGMLVCLVIYALVAPAHLRMVVTEAPFMFGALLTEKVLFFMLVGFIAQIIDGALGMAYGISSTTFLLGMGVPPAMASSSVHVAEVFTSGVSGLSHLKFGNVNKKLFQSLVLPGVLGVITGAYVLTTLDGKLIKPFIAAYLMLMGIVIIRKAFKKAQTEVKEVKKIALLAVFGGFMDAVGGGGWGPIVASTLISKGHNPRYTIGSVNLAEFFIALAGAGTFVALIGLGNWQIIAGLVIGGTFAAPFAAYLCKKFKAQTLMIMVGILIIVLSLRTLWLAFN